MAEFKLNNGNVKDLTIDQKYDRTKIYLSVNILCENDAIKVGGMTVINCLYPEIKDVIISDYPLTYTHDLYEKELLVKADVTKFKVKDAGSIAADVPVTCKLTLEAGDDLLENYLLDDTSNCTINSIFIFRIKFKKAD
jgi:hypothetical protein